VMVGISVGSFFEHETVRIIRPLNMIMYFFIIEILLPSISSISFKSLLKLLITHFGMLSNPNKQVHQSHPILQRLENRDSPVDKYHKHYIVQGTPAR